MFGLGLNAGIVGMAFWVLMCVSSFGALFGMLAQEGNGHEIVLEGDKEFEKKGSIEMKEMR